MNVPENLYYTKEHEWIRIEGKFATIGITDYAQHSLGDITFVELPSIGKVCKQFKQLATIESVKAASDVYAPLSGKVVKINEKLSEHPEEINKSPYENGWIAVIELSNEDEKKNLLKEDSYKEHIKGTAK
jgi:glycine cleavage system H protein